MMPPIIGARTPAPEAFGVGGSKPRHPTTNRLVTHIESALGKRVFDITEAEIEPQVQPDRMLDDGRRELKAAYEIGGIGRP